VVVGDIMYSISEGIVRMGKDWMQTVLKERTDNAERYVETAFGWSYRKKMFCNMECCFCILTAGMISAVYRVDFVCRICDGKTHYVKIT
jgi:hypothetical protein